jgi:hypothetical protein
MSPSRIYHGIPRTRFVFGTRRLFEPLISVAVTRSLHLNGCSTND